MFAYQSPSLAVDPIAFATIERQVEYISVACSAWLLHDWAYSLDNEIRLVWQSSNSLPKFLYFISRYFGLGCQLCQTIAFRRNECRQLAIFDVASAMVIIASVELSLILRLYALYGTSQIVLLFLCALLFVASAVVIMMAVYAFRQILPDFIPPPANWHTIGCIIPSSPEFYKLCWVPLLSFEVTLFFLNAYKCLSSGSLRETPIVSRLCRDGNIHFLTILVTLIISTVVSFMPNLILGNAAKNAWIPTVFSYSGSNLLLSVRRLAAKRIEFDTLPPISFTERYSR
ncbi:hypothetical protein CERSUDRAFT_124806, partial [Gelatoporia subvermispora B]